MVQKYSFKQVNILGLVGSSVSVISLIMLSLFTYDELFHSFVFGTSNLSSHEYVEYLKTDIIIDSAYLFGHIITWIVLFINLAYHNCKHLVIGLIPLFGISGAFLDFLENEIRWSLAIGVGHDVTSFDLEYWYVIWNIIYDFSYLLIFVTALIVAISFFNYPVYDRLIVFLGIIGLPIYIAIPYSGFTLSIIWLILWQLSCSRFFFKQYRSSGIN